MKRKLRIRTKTLEAAIHYFDESLHLPLSVDDALYMRWRMHKECFQRDYERLQKQLFEEWSRKYLVRFHDGYYEQGQLIENKMPST